MNHQINRRQALFGAGALTVTVLMPGVTARAQTIGLDKWPPLDARKLASYISIDQNGGATAYYGKMDMGQGTDVGVCQMIAEELDLPVEKVTLMQGDTDTSVNMGGASGSTGVQLGGKAMRSAGLPSVSRDSPMMRPGSRRLNSSRVAKNAACGPP